MRKNNAQDFWGKIDIENSIKVCWEWKGKRGTKEYAETRWHGKSIRCHRKAYELWYGDIPEGMLVCHKCDNPPCCNPYHLFLGTHQDNVDDRERKGRNKMPHSKGEEHGIHKLTESQVLEIVKLYYRGNYSYYSLADKYNVSFSNIRKIITGQTWGWLTGISA